MDSFVYTEAMSLFRPESGRTKGRSRISAILALAAVTSIPFSPLRAEDVTSTALTSPDASIVGWSNVLLPGAGRFFLGDTSRAALEFGGEFATFGAGYALKTRNAHFDLDGFTENDEVVSFATLRRCEPGGRGRRRRRCINSATPESESSSRQMKADLSAALQEIGIKAHMTNVFLSYRTALERNGGTKSGQGIDLRPTRELFEDPFRTEVLESPWVWAPLATLLAFTVADATSGKHGSDIHSVPELNFGARASFTFNQVALYPVGSAAPEEMFYRGFVQNEVNRASGSDWVAVPASAAAFAFSHGSEGRPLAAISGLYLGILAARAHGNLSQGIAVHYWSVLILGLGAVVSTLRKAGDAPPAALVSTFRF